MFACKPRTLLLCGCRFQELDLSAQCLISNESTREEPWINCVTTTLRKAGSYIMVSLVEHERLYSSIMVHVHVYTMYMHVE